ncbi:hypothetical protein COR50_15075 [Chitinophaga caeni]|uniref:LysM domain-containing protein n=1 Tax=Chitinophaga caeni TaxID=2029983 RepID=A0A291QWR5_9BACT|nr:hypothetical protein [Chitinophaga caeni]ATL48377.1 hypothetical protein COR50_15075 [Chitinophaga caeni]
MTKLKIISFDDPKTRIPVGQMDVLINPDTYSKKIEIKYSEKQAPGTTGKLPKFSKIEPDKMDFELLFDRTGVITDQPPGLLGVEEDIDQLKSLTVEYKGNKHRPRFVSLYWGTLKFDGCLQNMDISYKLFDPRGLPLRAVVRTTFMGCIEDIKRINRENAQSPDLTHVRVVKQGDTLPLMCYEIYGDSKYYIEVAKFNGLDNFREIQPADKIKFPPLA